MCSNGGYFSNGEHLFLIDPGDFQEVCVSLMDHISAVSNVGVRRIWSRDGDIGISTVCVHQLATMV
jgi:hypothetical protein